MPKLRDRTASGRVIVPRIYVRPPKIRPFAKVSFAGFDPKEKPL